MTDLITRCPDCSCSFKVSPVQLKVASGQVRCGSCQKIFNGLDHVIAKQVIGEKGLVEQPIDSDDILIYDDMPLAAELSEDESVPIEEGVAGLEAAKEIQSDYVPPHRLEEANCFDVLSPEFLVVEPVLIPPAKANFNKRQLISLPWVVMLLLAMPMQYAYFNAPVLAEISSMQPYIETLCRVSGCRVFARDLEQLHITNLRIASHPEQKGVLRVSGKLSNKAQFRQRIPKLEVRFENLQGFVVAQRIFTPAEYVHGQFQAKGLIPRNRSLLFNIDIVDPGDDAQSYSFVLH